MDWELREKARVEMSDRFSLPGFLIYLSSGLFAASIRLKSRDPLISAVSPHLEFSVERTLVTFVSFSLIWLLWMKFSGILNAKSYFKVCLLGSTILWIFESLYHGMFNELELAVFLLTGVLPMLIIFFTVAVFAISYPLQVLLSRVQWRLE